MRQDRSHSPEEIVRLHERAAHFFDLLDQRERADAERELARRVRQEGRDRSRDERAASGSGG